jgi:hypothetical protein
MVAHLRRGGDLVLDLVRGRDPFPIFHRVGWWSTVEGCRFAGLYVVAMVAVILALRA